jgi:crotonobetaine/carnitine-CoA ligase
MSGELGPRWDDLRALVADRARAAGERTFLELEESAVSFAALDERSNRVANALRALGVGRGQIIAVFLPNCAEFLYAWFAAAKIGAVIAPINSGFRSAEARYILQHTEAAVLVTTADLWREEIQPVLPECPQLHNVITLGEPAERTIPFAHLLQASAEEPPPIALDGAATPAVILYTSGTTGYPKGCVLPHRYFILNGDAILDGMGIQPEDRLYMPLPLFHVNAEITLVGALLRGCTYLLRPRLSVSRFWDDVIRSGATEFNHIGAMVSLLAKEIAPGAEPEHALRVGCGGGAPVEVQRQFRERFGITLVELYATTESGMDTMGDSRRSGPDAPQRPGSAGRPVWFKHIRVVDEQGRSLPPGQVGEIATCAAEPGAVMLGYFKDPDATAAAVREGWYHTGDFGKLDADGYLYYVDRKKDLIRRSGENIASVEVERVLKTHPAVLDAAVVAVRDEVRGEEIKACVELRPGVAPESVPPAGLISYCEQHLARFKAPRFVRYYDKLPRNASQRVQKHVLRDERDPRADCYDREAEAL